jgi:hypothetical protein
MVPQLSHEIPICDRILECEASDEFYNSFLCLEAVIWLAIVMALGRFIYEHIGTLKFVLVGAASC